MKYDILVQTFMSSLARKHYLPFLAQKLEKFFFCQNPFQAIIRLKKKWYGPLSHWCREGKTLVVRPLKKNYFFMYVFPKCVIEKYHVGYNMETMKHVTDMDVSKIETDLTDQAKIHIISTRIRCARNLASFPLNTSGTKKSRMEIADLMEKVFAMLPEDLQGTFYRHSKMSEDEIKGWVQKHFLFRGRDKMQAASGYHADWPHGRGIFVSKDEHFLLRG